MRERSECRVIGEAEELTEEEFETIGDYHRMAAHHFEAAAKHHLAAAAADDEGDEEANAKLTVVDAYPIATVKFDVVAVALFASVTLTDTVEEPATAGVPEMVPVEVAKLRPLTKVPVKAYVSAVRPPDPATTNENALFAVPDKPVVGVAIESSPATVNATAEDVVDTATFPLKVLVTLTPNAPASVVATGLMV